MGGLLLKNAETDGRYIVNIVETHGKVSLKVSEKYVRCIIGFRNTWQVYCKINLKEFLQEQKLHSKRET